MTKTKLEVWLASPKYVAKGDKGCGSRHIDDGILYVAFVNTFNAVVENKDYFMGKWEDQSNGEDILKRVIAKRFITIFKTAKPLDRFDVDLYFKLTEKITVYDGKLVFSLIDGSDVECEIE